MGRKRISNVVEQQRGNKTTIYARVSVTDPNGKRRQIWRKANSRSEARDIAERLRRQIEDHGLEVVEHSRTTVAEYLKRWLQALKGKVTGRTHSDYTDLTERYILPKLARHTLGGLTPGDVQALYAEMQARGLSARTIRYTHSVLRSAIQQALKWGVVSRNVATLVSLPKVARREMHVLNPEQAKLFLVACRGERLGSVFAFALATGMRPEEYLGLQWGDLDLDAGRASIQRVVSFHRDGGGSWSFVEPKTSGSRRSVPLPIDIVKWLREHRRAQAERRLRLGDKWVDNGLVFASTGGGPLHLRNLTRRHFHPILQATAGLIEQANKTRGDSPIPALPERFRLYDLRHTCATLMLAAGVNAKVTAERLGHASTTLTLDTYSHTLPGMQQQATEALGRLLFAANE